LVKVETFSRKGRVVLTCLSGLFPNEEGGEGDSSELYFRTRKEVDGQGISCIYSSSNRGPYGISNGCPHGIFPMTNGDHNMICVYSKDQQQIPVECIFYPEINNQNVCILVLESPVTNKKGEVHPGFPLARTDSKAPEDKNEHAGIPPGGAFVCGYGSTGIFDNEKADIFAKNISRNLWRKVTGENKVKKVSLNGVDYRDGGHIPCVCIRDCLSRAKYIAQDLESEESFCSRIVEAIKKATEEIKRLSLQDILFLGGEKSFEGAISFLGEAEATLKAQENEDGTQRENKDRLQAKIEALKASIEATKASQHSYAKSQVDHSYKGSLIFQTCENGDLCIHGILGGGSIGKEEKEFVENAAKLNSFGISMTVEYRPDLAEGA
jgi:hypothetical protein